MKLKSIIFIVVLFISTNVFAKQYFSIEDNQKVEITFDAIDVAAGAIEEQLITVSDTENKEYSGVLAYITQNKVPNDWKRMLPYETYVNPSFRYRYEIGYSPSNGVIAVIRRLDNRSESEDWEVLEETITLEWYLIKNKRSKDKKDMIKEPIG
jgi:hypothetical protein